MNYVTKNEETGFKSCRHSNILVSRKSITILFTTTPNNSKPGSWFLRRLPRTDQFKSSNSREAQTFTHTQTELLLLLTQKTKLTSTTS